ncbi:MAG: hypothetical protein ACTSQJ_04090 [Promethearchaeota archaeon]
MTRFKDYSIYLKFLIIFLISLLIFYQFIPRIVKGTLDIWVNISELGGNAGHFSLSYRLILEIIFMGPIFGILYYFLMKRLISEIDENQGRNKYYIYLIEISIITFICISVMGHTIHMLFDHASRLYFNTYGSMDTSELYSFLYYSDEWLGHHLIHIAYFGYIVTALFAEFLGNNHKKMNLDELIIDIFLGICLSIIAYSTYEGQAALIMLILWTSLLCFEIIIIIVKKIKILERPILLATIINNLIVILLFIWWITLYGVKPYYPIIYQPSELQILLFIVN